MKTVCGDLYWLGKPPSNTFLRVNVLRYWQKRAAYWKSRVNLVENRVDQLEREIKRLKTKAGE